jgi:hypothetical protein
MGGAQVLVAYFHQLVVFSQTPAGLRGGCDFACRGSLLGR